MHGSRVGSPHHKGARQTPVLPQLGLSAAEISHLQRAHPRDLQQSALATWHSAGPIRSCAGRIEQTGSTSAGADNTCILRSTASRQAESTCALVRRSCLRDSMAMTNSRDARRRSCRAVKSFHCNMAMPASASVSTLPCMGLQPKRTGSDCQQVSLLITSTASGQAASAYHVRMERLVHLQPRQRQMPLHLATCPAQRSGARQHAASIRATTCASVAALHLPLLCAAAPSCRPDRPYWSG